MQNNSVNPSDLNPHLQFDGVTGELQFEKTDLSGLAQTYGTPLYVYSASSIKEAYRAYASACEGLANVTICYAVKANSNVHILKALAQEGAGFDIVSAGELARVIAAGGKPQKAVFAGVGKSAQEIEYALSQGVGCFNVESEAEMTRIGQVAEKMQRMANVSLRVNPDVDAKTHPYISTGLKENKFGVSMNAAPRVYQFAHAHPWLNVHGIDCHIGSQLTDASPYFDALDRVLALLDQLAADGIEINHLDLGGGIGIRYLDETPPTPAEVLPRLIAKVKDWAQSKGRSMPTLSFEPGRSIVGNAGVLLTQVEFLKENEGKHFAIVDAAMNDLMRPAMYKAFHGVVAVQNNAHAQPQEYDVVGPVCESGDWLAKNRTLAIEQGDYLAILSAGAYGQTMASNYNSRGRAAEVLIENGEVTLIRRRETIEDQLRPELDV
ncbi:diaminopimelate decarboxylase [Limnobacter thiooxidans]|uniref:Diaminopimelate decarboxylase n=1 Tax=Limnobacter thiooxidans TaxID=131080 RepID=A0AA86J2J3_9BURK|nr:diaminopimelate decarboxylase [Limnobacter thiooxidans]BET27293.1 diaminopimelate decarboxylase [Limnobacter thiooxidans]